MYDNAESCLLELLKSRVFLADINFMLGNISIKKAQLLEAENYYKQCIKVNEQYAEAYNNLGIIYSINNNALYAQEMFRKALTLRTYYSDPLENIKNKDINESKWHYTFTPLRDVLKPSEL